MKKKLSLFKEVAIFSIIIISFKIGFIVLWNIAVFGLFWLRTICMDYVNCESAKEMDRISLFEKKLSLFKEVAIFSIIIISFKKGFIVFRNIAVFGLFWLRTIWMDYVNCESAKEMDRISFFEKKLSLFKEVAIFSIIIISFKIGFIVLWNIAVFGLFWLRTIGMDYVNCESAIEMDRISLFEKKLSLFKEVAIFSIIIISFKISFIVFWNIAVFGLFWLRTICMDYVNCESAKEMDRISLFEKKLSLFKEVAIFSIIIISFKIGFIVLWNIAVFGLFWLRTICMDYVNCESAKEMDRISLFEKKLSLFKEVAIFSIIIISFKIGFIVLWNIAVFGLFWLRTICMDYVNCESAKEMDRISLFEKKLSLFKEVAIFSIIIISFKIGFIVLWNIAVFGCFWLRTICMDNVNCESAIEMDRISLFEKKLSLFKEVAIFSIIIISFKIGFIVLWNIAVFGLFWLRTICMDYVNCESAKEMDRISLFEKKLSLFKEVSIFSITIISFKKGFIVLWNIAVFGLFWLRTIWMNYVNCESAKETDRISLFEKKLSLFKEVAIFSIIIISFKIGFIVLWNIAVFGLFWLRTIGMDNVNCESAIEMDRISLFDKKLSLFKEVAIFSIIIISFKIGFLVLWNIAVFGLFWLRTICMDYVNCESAKEMDRISFFEKKLSLFKEGAIFSIISFKIRL